MRSPEADAEIQELAQEELEQDRSAETETRTEHGHAIRRTILSLATREASTYGATAHEVIESILKGNARPELQRELDTQFSALGVPPNQAMGLIAGVFSADDLGIGDLMILVQGYSGQMPTPAQAREISDMSTRLARIARRHAKRVSQAQVIADTINERERIENPLPARPPRTFHQTRASRVAIPGRGISR